MAFCLLPQLAEKFKKALVSGKIDPIKLNELSSEQRRAVFEELVGEVAAKKVNALFESKLLLKNKEQGMITWAKQVSGIKPETRRDMLAKITRMNENGILSPAEEKAFLADLAEQRLGIGVTTEEAVKITKLSQDAEALRVAMDGTHDKRVAYGRSLMDLNEYLEKISPTKLMIKTSIWNTPKSLMSTFDLSAPLRQGWGMVSRKEFYTSFVKMFKYAASEEQFKKMSADIITRPTYNQMRDGGLRIYKLTDKLGERPEEFMAQWLEKIPVFKTLYKASERGFTGFLNVLRADTFDHLLAAAEMSGEDVTKGSQVLKDLANVVNDFTGSGNLGKGDKYSNLASTLNNVFFSPRKISATVNMFNPKRYLDPKVSPTARKAAIRQLAGSVAMTTGVLGLLKLNGAQVETDPRSTDFGKVVLGKARFDFTGGNGTYAVLLARLYTNQTKSTTTGIIKDLDKGFKPVTRKELVINFFSNKLAPSASYLTDWMANKDSSNLGQEFNAVTGLRDRMYPLIIGSVINAYEEQPQSIPLVVLAELFGIGVNIYDEAKNEPKYKGLERILTKPESVSSGTLKNSESEAVLFLKDKFPDDEFDKVDAEYLKNVQDAYKKLQGDSRYQKMSDDEKYKQLRHTRDAEVDKLVVKYGYKAPKKAKPMNYIK